MALDVSGSQIYAGRYHYRRSEMPDLFREDVVQSRREKKSINEQYSVDTVTFSEEGMAKAKAKDWRAYTIDNPDISHVNIKEQREELYRQLNTVNKVDTASMFNLELGEVASQIQKENGGGEHAGSHEAFLMCHGVLLQPETSEESDEQHKIFIEKAEDEYYVRVQHEMTKTHYISFIAAVSSERIQLVKRYPEEEAEAGFKMQGVHKIFFFCNKDGVFSLDVKKGIDDKEAAYSDHEIRRKQEKIMDIFYEFGELMNLDPCNEKVQKAAEELHEITGGQKQVGIEMLNDKY